MTNKQAIYKRDGVDLELEDNFSQYAAERSKETYKNSPYVKLVDLSRGDFRGPRGYNLIGLPKGYLETGVVDGIGTKVILIDAAKNYNTAAFNLLVMVSMDITRYGGLPLLILNIFDVKTLGANKDSKTFLACKEIIDGLVDLANREAYVIQNGETAELGSCVSSENPNADVAFNWGCVMLGVYHPNKMILGDTLASGQTVIALQDGFRSNGISSVRKALALQYGAEWWANPSAYEDIIAAATPARQYDRLLNSLHGWFSPPKFKPKIKMHLIVHLSGGAFKSKLSRILEPLGLAVDLPNLFNPPEIMRRCAEWRKMSNQECYETWNGGQGALVVVDNDDKVISAFLARADSCGIKAKVAGKIIKKQSQYNVAITSKFTSKTRVYF